MINKLGIYILCSLFISMTIPTNDCHSSTNCCPTSKVSDSSTSCSETCCIQFKETVTILEFSKDGLILLGTLVFKEIAPYPSDIQEELFRPPIV